MIPFLCILASGLLLFAANPPLDLSPLAFVALIPLYYGAFARPGDAPFRLRRAFWVGYGSGTLYIVTHMHWLLRLSKDEVTIPWIMFPALLIMGLYLGLFPGLACLWTAWIHRRTGISPVWILPVLWTLTDWFRTTGEAGFPWGSAGYTLAPWSAAIQMTAFTGYWFLPAWILWVNGMLWRGAVARERGPRRLAWRLAVAAVAFPVALGSVLLSRAPETVRVVEGSTQPLAATYTVDPDGNRVELHRGPPPGSDAPSDAEVAPNRVVLPSRTERPTAFGPGSSALRFSLIQANTPREVKWRDDYRSAVISDLLYRSEQANNAYDPDLLVWPETAAPLRVLWQASLRKLMEERIGRIDKWVLVGSLDAEKIDGEFEYYNSSILYAPSGQPNQKFPKRRMVPFGELTPYKDKIPLLSKINFGQSDFTPGREPSLFAFGPQSGRDDSTAADSTAADRRFSCLICFEATFPSLARSDVAAGAEYLINITNDFWYGASAEPIQHAQFAIHRAVENRTPLVRCANSGVSFVVDPYGRIHGQTGLFETALLTVDVLPGQGGTFYTRWGDWILWFFAACAGSWTVLGVLRRKKLEEESA